MQARKLRAQLCHRSNSKSRTLSTPGSSTKHEDCRAPWHVPLEISRSFGESQGFSRQDAICELLSRRTWGSSPHSAQPLDDRRVVHSSMACRKVH